MSGKDITVLVTLAVAVLQFADARCSAQEALRLQELVEIRTAARDTCVEEYAPRGGER